MLTLGVKSSVVWGTSTFRENFCSKYFLFFISFIFMQIKSSLLSFKKNYTLYILDPQILLGKTPYHILFSAGSSQLMHISEQFLCF